MTSTEDLLDLSWLDLAEEYAPAGYRESLQAEAEGAARRAVVDGALSRLSAAVFGAVVDDPLRAVGPAAELAGVRIVSEMLPTVPVVSHEAHADLVAALAGVFRDPRASLGVPPAIFAERAHAQQYHRAGSVEIFTTDLDLASMTAFTDAAQAAAGTWRGIASLTAPLLPSESVAQRVRVWHQVTTTTWPRLLDELGRLRDTISEANEARWASPYSHRCPMQSGGGRFALRPVPLSVVPWTFEKNGFDSGFVDSPEMAGARR